MQTQTSNTLHNAIMEAGSKGRPPMLAPGNYIQWKSRIKRYIDTKPNHELIHYCLENPPYELGWKDKRVPDSDENFTTTTKRVFETYKNVTQDIRDQLNAEAEAVQFILTGIDNDIYSLDGESLESYYSRFYKMMNELIKNQCKVTNHQVNVQFLLRLQPEWKRFVTLVKQSQELKTVSYQKLYDILEQHQHEVNEIRAENIARVANPLVLVAQQQPVYHPQTHPTHYNQNSSTRLPQAATQPIYDQEPSMVDDDDDETSKDKEIDKLMALISLSFMKIYKPTNNNLRTSSNTSRANQDNSLRINRNAGECQKPKRAKDAAYHREKMLLSHYMYMAKIQEVSPDAVDSGPIFDTELEQKIDQNDEDVIFPRNSKAELKRRDSIEYASEMELECAKVRDKGIAISELKKLIEKLKGKSMETKFEKSSVIRQPNAFKSQRPSILGKPTTFSNYFVRKDFSKSTSVTQTHVSNNFSKPVPAQILLANKKSILKNTNVINPGMYKIHTDHTQTRTSKLPPDSRKTNKHVTFSTGVILSTNVSRPQLKRNPMGDRVLRNNSRGKKQEVKDHRRNVKLPKNKTSVTAYQNNSDPAPECQTMASDQNSSDPAPECQTMALNHDSLSPVIQCQRKVTQADRTVTTSNELDLLFSLMFDELLNGSSKVVSKSSAVSAVNAPNQRQQYTTPLNNHTTPAPTYHGETSSRHVDSSNVHTFYQRFPSEHRWTKDHPLEQVIGNPSQPVRTRRQLESDVEMCMFTLTVSRTEPKNIKEAMADSAWIESIQEELHQFDRLDVWELVDRPLCTNVINLKWLWKNKRDEENTVIRNKSRLVAKGYAQKEGVILKNLLHPSLGWKP
uniref:Gag-Pol polyprotein n=1 Tax=Tanacetum cinerariifolium TaxID=118510 RepID=A0A6L2NEX8_TANCI|nr:Gag-Pol polyprotein [Tanacetum cinerariifolium]